MSAPRIEMQTGTGPRAADGGRSHAPADAHGAVAARARRRQDPAPAGRRPRRHPGRAAPGHAGRPAGAQRARGHPPLRQPLAPQLQHRLGLLSPRLVHHEVQPQGQRVGGPPVRLRQAPPAGARRGRAGHARAALEPRTAAQGDQRHGRGHAPAGGRGTGRADRHPDGPCLPRVTRRSRPPRGHRARLVPRHEPRDRLDGRLHDHHRALGRGRRGGPRGAPGRALAADGGSDADQPLDPRAVREPHRRAARRRPCGRRPGLHGRRQPERRDGQVPPRRGRLRRHALQRPQDLLDAARRRRPGCRAGRGRRAG